jgi:hypothetical protein
VISSFVNPGLLAAGLLAVSLPVLIHILLRRRRRPVPWAAMKFLMEAYRRQRRRARLEQLLLLLSRCAVVGLLAAALGRPMIGEGGLLSGGGARLVCIVIDDSLTSDVRAEGGRSELDGHKEAALRVLGELDASAGDQAMLITMGAPASAAVEAPSSDIPGVMAAVRAIRGQSGPADVEGALGLAREAMATWPAGRIGNLVLLTSWRAGSVDLTKQPAGLNAPGVDPSAARRVQVTAPASSVVENVRVVSVASLRPVLVAPDAEGGRDEPVSVEVRVELSRSGGLPASTGGVSVSVVSASGEATEAVRLPVAWGAGQASAVVSGTVGVPAAMARSSSAVVLRAAVAGDALPGDDVWSVPLVSRRVLRVAVVSRSSSAGVTPGEFSAGDWLSLALSPEVATFDRRGMEVEVVRIDAGSEDLGSVLGCDAVFVASPEALSASGWTVLRRALDGGALVALFAGVAGARGDSGGVAAWAERVPADLGIGWRIARESKALEGVVTATASGRGFLSQIGPELDELLRPIRVSRVLPIEGSEIAGEVLLRAGDEVLMASSPGPGGRGLAVYVSASMDLGWTNLPAMPMMVPLAQEVLRQGVARSLVPGVWSAGESPGWPAGAEQARPIADGEGESVRAGGQLGEAIRRVSSWRVLDGSGRTLGLSSVNAAVGGSRVEPQGETAVRGWLDGWAGAGNWSRVSGSEGESGAGAEAEREAEGAATPLDAWLLAGVLALVLVEMVLARRFSHANVSERTPGLSGTLREPKGVGGARGEAAA